MASLLVSHLGHSGSIVFFPAFHDLSLFKIYEIFFQVHFSALLSAVGEQNVPLAIEVNANASNKILEVAR